MVLLLGCRLISACRDLHLVNPLAHLVGLLARASPRLWKFQNLLCSSFPWHYDCTDFPETRILILRHRLRRALIHFHLPSRPCPILSLLVRRDGRPYRNFVSHPAERRTTCARFPSSGLVSL